MISLGIVWKGWNSEMKAPGRRAPNVSYKPLHEAFYRS